MLAKPLSLSLSLSYPLSLSYSLTLSLSHSETNLDTPDGWDPVQTVLMNRQRGKLHTDSSTRAKKGQETTREVPRSARSQQTQLGNAAEEGFTSQLQRTKNCIAHKNRHLNNPSQVQNAKTWSELRHADDVGNKLSVRLITTFDFFPAQAAKHAEHASFR